MPPSAASGPLADAVLASVPLVTRFLKGFDDANRTRQAPGLPNHAAWCLGHLSLTMHRVAEMLDGRPLPAGEIAPGAGESRDRKASPSAYFAETIALGSRPTDDPSLYPPLARGASIFETAAARLADAIRAADDAALDRETPWGTGATTMRALIPRMIFHNGCHAGQLVDLRRALGMAGVIG